MAVWALHFSYLYATGPIVSYLYLCHCVIPVTWYLSVTDG